MRWKVTLQNFVSFCYCLLEYDRLFILFPLQRARAVAEIRIKVFRLHDAERAVGTEVVAFAAKADFFNIFETERFLIYLDAARKAQGIAENVVIEQEAFRTGAKKARVHAGGLVNDVGAR